jgi:hypothetical protein
MNPNYILLAIPFFLFTVIGEWLHNFIKNRGKDFDFADSMTNLNLGIGSQAIGALTKAGSIDGIRLSQCQFCILAFAIHMV